MSASELRDADLTSGPASHPRLRGGQPRRRFRRYLFAAVLIASTAWALVVAISVVRAVDDLQAGVREMDQARTATTLSSLTSGAPVADVERSAADLRAAHRLLHSAWISPVRLLPYLGRQLESLDALSGAAAQVATAAQHAASQAQGLLQQPHATPAQRLRMVQSMSAIVSAFSADTAHLDLGPSNALLPTLARKRNTFADELTSLRATLTKAEGATQALGALLTGSHTYLLMATNNAEMRDGTGTALELGTITARSGVLTLASLTPASDLAMPSPKVPVTGDLAARWGFLEPNQDWRNLDLSPRFPANSELAAAMWQAQTGQPVEGVLDVDVGFLADVLAVTGPLSVDGMTLDGSNAADTLMKYQYSGLPVNDPNYDSRQEHLGALAEAAFRAVQAPDVPISHLVEALASSAAARHVLVWSSDPGLERDWIESGVSGEPASNGIMVGLVNRGGNKLDPYMSLSARLAVAPAHDSTTVSVTVTVKNRATSDAPSYANGGSTYPPGTYAGYLDLEAPGWAAPIQSHSSLPLVAAGRDGTEQVLAGRLELARGGTTSVTYSFQISSAHASLTIEPSARIPATAWATPNGDFSDTTAHRVQW